jgi:hypothetical protein
MTSRDRTAPTGAESPSPASERRSRHPAHTPPLQSSVVDSDCAPQDRTDARIRAFISSMRPMRGSSGARSDAYQRGRELIENLAVSAEDDGSPALRFTRSDCADVAAFLMFSEPVAPRDWWSDDNDEPSPVVGYHFVLGALEDSLRAEDASPEAQPQFTEARALTEAVEDQRHNVAKLTFRTEENDADVSLLLLALRYQFEAIEYALDTEGNDTKASYLALGGAAIAQGLIERLDDEEAP